MSDRFKFRVFQPKYKRYYDGMSHIDNHGYLHVGSAGYYADATDIAEQCTGLKDKNGKLIYEGDIVKLHHQKSGTEATAVIEFCKVNSGFVARDIDYQTTEWNLAINDWEIIGNIHENPELLEVK